MKLTRIGSISNGVDGEDQYVLVQRVDKDVLTPEQAREWLLPIVYRNTNTPGANYCTSVLAVQAEYSNTDVICTIQQRWDV